MPAVCVPVQGPGCVWTSMMGDVLSASSTIRQGLISPTPTRILFASAEFTFLPHLFRIDHRADLRWSPSKALTSLFSSKEDCPPRNACPVFPAVRWEARRSELALITLSLKGAQLLTEMFLRSRSGFLASSVFCEFDGSLPLLPSSCVPSEVLAEHPLSCIHLFFPVYTFFFSFLFNRNFIICPGEF